MNNLQPHYGANDYKILQAERKHSGYLKLDVVRYQQRCFSGAWSAPLQRDLSRARPAVGVLLLNPQLNQVILVEQCRVGALQRAASPWLYEIVAGVVEDGEQPEDAARREAREEAHCTIEKLHFITSYLVSPGTSDEQVTLFLGLIANYTANGAIGGNQQEQEDIKIHVVACEDAFAAVSSGVINNSLSIIALQWLQLHKDSIK